MTKEEMLELKAMMKEVVGDELKPINARLDKIETEVKEVRKDTKYIKKQVDILYEWTDGIDLDVRELKKAK